MSDGIADGDAGQAAATIERIVADVSDGVGDGCSLASYYERVGSCLYNSVTVVT